MVAGGEKMEDMKKRLLYLCHFPGITWNEIYKILKNDTRIFAISKQSPHKILDPNPNRQNLLDSITTKLHSYAEKGIQVITYFDDNYPKMLKEIYQPPWCLFTKGNVNLLTNSRKLAFVGAREATLYGKNAIIHLLPPLLEKKMIIVSGLAKGIDSLAHQCTIDYGGQTIGVIAGGFNHIYPKENRLLAEKICNDHLLISEYPPETKPLKWHFPARNRIISGLCEGTIIIEAKRKSGSLITANYAIQEGREVFAVPGSIFSPYSEGTNELIGQGAKLVMSGEDVLVELRK
jgi:DNA processing protein